MKVLEELDEYGASRNRLCMEAANMVNAGKVLIWLSPALPTWFKTASSAAPLPEHLGRTFRRVAAAAAFTAAVHRMLRPPQTEEETGYEVAGEGMSSCFPPNNMDTVGLLRSRAWRSGWLKERWHVANRTAPVHDTASTTHCYHVELAVERPVPSGSTAPTGTSRPSKGVASGDGAAVVPHQGTPVKPTVRPTAVASIRSKIKQHIAASPHRSPGRVPLRTVQPAPNGDIAGRPRTLMADEPLSRAQSLIRAKQNLSTPERSAAKLRFQQMRQSQLLRA